MTGIFLIFCGLVALAFLIYSIANLKKLSITLTHPRVIVEFVLFVGFTLAGILVLIS